jgi:transposase InsO family protein
MKYRFMADHRREHRVEKMAANLGVTRSGFYAWARRGKSPRRVRDERLQELIKEIQQEAKYRYGSPRVTKELGRKGHRVGHNRVARLMREGQLGARPRKGYRVTTKSNHSHPVAENLLARNFSVSAANRVWVSDITYIATAEGWMYLCVVLDLYSRRVVGWSMGRRLGAQLAVQALLMALMARRPPRGLMLHSDRGVQYCAGAFRDLATKYGVVQSMSRKGDCWDNACAETFFASLKTELIGDHIFVSREQGRREIFEYMEVFYNRRRLHSYLGYLTPTEFEGSSGREAA